MDAAAPSRPAYREWLLPGPTVWLAVLVVAVGFGVIGSRPFGAPGFWTGAGLALAALAGVLLSTSPRLVVQDDWLHTRSARIRVPLLGQCEVLDSSAMRAATGPQLDARAHLDLRPWVRTGVRIAVEDADDPTPYWLLSTRHPGALKAALHASAPPD